MVMFLDEVHDLKDRFADRFQIVHVLSRELQDVELLSGRLDGDRLRRILETVAPAMSTMFSCAARSRWSTSPRRCSPTSGHAESI